MDEPRQRRARLTPDQKWQIFLEASRKNTTDAEVCRKWGITVWQLKAIRERVKDGSLRALKRGPGRSKADPEISELRQSGKGLPKVLINNFVFLDESRSKTAWFSSRRFSSLAERQSFRVLQQVEDGVQKCRTNLQLTIDLGSFLLQT